MYAQFCMLQQGTYLILQQDSTAKFLRICRWFRCRSSVLPKCQVLNWSIQWVFTMGLSTAATVDILVAAAMCWYLDKNRTGFVGWVRYFAYVIISSSSHLGVVIYQDGWNHRFYHFVHDTKWAVDLVGPSLPVVEMVILTGSTSITTVVSLICVCLYFVVLQQSISHISFFQWVSMPGNLIFLGLHFAISKRMYTWRFQAPLFPLSFLSPFFYHLFSSVVSNPFLSWHNPSIRECVLSNVSTRLLLFSTSIPFLPSIFPSLVHLRHWNLLLDIISDELIDQPRNFSITYRSCRQFEPSLIPIFGAS